MKYFNTPGIPPLYSGETTIKPEAETTASREGTEKATGFSAQHEAGEKISGGSNARSSTRKGTFRLYGINFLELPGHFAGIAAGAIGAHNESNHPEENEQAAGFNQASEKKTKHSPRANPPQDKTPAARSHVTTGLSATWRLASCGRGRRRKPFCTSRRHTIHNASPMIFLDILELP